MNEDAKIGSQLRIRMPADYISSDGPTMERPGIRVTAGEVGRLAHQRMVDDCARLLLSANSFMDKYYETHPPLTRWQRWRRDVRDLLRRFPDAWGVITGRLEARDPDADW